MKFLSFISVTTILISSSIAVSCSASVSDCDKLKEPAIEGVKLHDEFVTGILSDTPLSSNRASLIAQSLETKVIPQLSSLRLSDPTLQRLQREMKPGLVELQSRAKAWSQNPTIDQFRGKKNFAVPELAIAYMEAETYCSGK